MIQELSAEFGVRDICQALQVQRSGYYRWLKSAPGPRQRSNLQLLDSIRRAHQEARQTYGSPRMTRHLKRQNIPCSENRVARLMKLHGIRAAQKRPFRPRTTDSRHSEAIADNWLKVMPAPASPDQAWAADITYIWTAAGWVYLAAVMDLCSRKIVGWFISRSLESDLVKEALKQALVVRHPAPGLLHHSDRGIQYASSAFRALLLSQKITPSMSAKGNCYDNAAMEAFWSTLKAELIHRHHFLDLAQARLAIFEYIEIFYNRKRLHSALGYQSPVEFEQQLSYKKN
ncbi:MAG: IS3 family transposase [Verrucomicrobiota bacterium]